MRAGLVSEAVEWKWSSAAAHCGYAEAEPWLDTREWSELWDRSSWQAWLRAGASESEMAAVRRCTHTGRPLGSESFVRELEEKTARQLAPQKGGRPAVVEDERQGEFAF